MRKIRSCIVMTNEPAPEGFPAGSNVWRVTLRYNGRRLTVPFYTSPLCGEPTTANVVLCLVADTASFDYTSGFEDWARDFVFDPDSRKAKATYNDVARQSAALRRLLGEDFDEIARLDSRKLALRCE